MRSRTSLVFVALVGVVLAAPACGEIAGIEDPAPTAGGGDSAPDGPGAISAEISPAEIDIGPQPCGTEAPAPQMISIANTGSARAEYKVELPEGTPFRLDGALTGSIEPGAPAVTIKAYVNPSVVGDMSTDALVSVGPVVKSVALKAKGSGAALEIKPPIVAFGEVRMQLGAKADVTIHNGGDRQLLVTGFSGTTADFSVNPPALAIEPGAAGTVGVMLKGQDTPDGAAISATLMPVVQDPLCGAAQSIVASGWRVSKDVIVSSGDFGPQHCNSSPTKKVTISNYSRDELTYNAALGSGPFRITSPGPGTVAPGNATTPSTAEIVLEATATKTLGVASTKLDVTVTPNGGATTVNSVDVSIDVRGAIIVANPVSITDFKPNDRKGLTISNIGNETVRLTWDFDRTGGDAAWPWWGRWGFPGSLRAGRTANASILFAPTGSCPPCELKADAHASGAAICNEIPTLLFQGTY